ncbi:hypothetical protein GF319_10940 [Candidatus Bathyarchaeota archaeon]|nr:hypothetical protein [Candidatus Bathyarchaeota archaeon]
MVKLIQRHSLKISLLMLLILSVSVTVASAGEIVLDQKQELEDGSTSLDKDEIGQEFTPTMSPLVAVEIKIRTANTLGDDTIIVNIRDSTIDGPILGTSSQLVIEGFEGWIRFDFPPIPLDPGSLYVIEVEVSKKTFAWYEGPGDVYPGGQGITFGDPYMDDFVFRTYAELNEPVGGELLPTGSILSILPIILAVTLITLSPKILGKK